MTRVQKDHALLASTVKGVLLSAWDPIGIQELPLAMREANADEYDSYIDAIIQMILNGHSEQDVGDYLQGVESRKMGLKPQFSRARAAAKALMELKRKFPATAEN